MAEHSTVNYNRAIGVEFECLCPVTEEKSRHEFQRALARILTANGIPAIARGYSTAPVTRGYVACVEVDESLRPPLTLSGINWANLEIKTKKMCGIAEYDRYVPRLLEVLTFLNCGVNGSAGLHVSLDAEDDYRKNPRFIRSMLNLTWRFEPVIYGLVSPSRIDCGFASPMPDLRNLWKQNTNESVRRRLLERWDKRCGINIRPLLSPPYPGGTRVEFRWHEGTLDSRETRNWIVFLLRLIDHAATHNCKTPRHQVPNDRRGFEKLMTTIGMQSNSRAYRPVSQQVVAARRSMLRRWKHFAGQRAGGAGSSA